MTEAIRVLGGHQTYSCPLANQSGVSAMQWYLVLHVDMMLHRDASG